MLIDASLHPASILNHITTDLRIPIRSYQIDSCSNEELEAKLSVCSDDVERDKLQRTIKKNEKVIKSLMPHYGPRHERIKDPTVREAELIVGRSFDLEDFEDDEETPA